MLKTLLGLNHKLLCCLNRKLLCGLNRKFLCHHTIVIQLMASHTMLTQPNIQNIPWVENFNVDDLKRLLVNLKVWKVTTSAQATSPFTSVIREATLPAGYKSTTHDLRCHENFDLVKFLWKFNIEMDVYQVQDLSWCKLSAAPFRDIAQHLFQKLGPEVISLWEHMKMMFLTQFHSTEKYTPLVTVLRRGNFANLLQKIQCWSNRSKRCYGWDSEEFFNWQSTNRNRLLEAYSRIKS